MKRSLIVVGCTIALLAAGGIAVDWYRSGEALMSQKPSRDSTVVVLNPKESVVIANLRVGYPVISNALNQALDNLPGSESGRERFGCIKNSFPPINECIDLNWRVNYARAGSIEVGRDGSHLKVTLPGEFRGRAGFGGTIARLLGLDAKNFSGSFVVSASATLSLDDQFCPVLAPGNITFEWANRGRVEMIGRTSVRFLGIGFSIGPWNLEVARYLDLPITMALRSALAEASRAIPCDPVRTELAKAWRHYSIPVDADNVPPLYVNIEPTGLATSGLIAEDEGVRLVARMNAKAVVAAEKGSEDLKTPLPVHEAVSAERGELVLAIPLKVPYDLLRSEAMKAMAGRPLSVGDAEIKIHDLEIYPSGNRVAIGVRFSSDLPWRIFNARGVVWLTASPAVDEDGKVVSLQDIEITRQLDSTLWSILTLVLRDVVHEQLETAATYDLTADSEAALAAIVEAITAPQMSGGVRFEIEDADLSLGRIVAESENIAVEGLFRAKWDAQLEDIDI